MMTLKGEKDSYCVSLAKELEHIPSLVGLEVVRLIVIFPSEFQGFSFYRIQLALILSLHTIISFRCQP